MRVLRDSTISTDISTGWLKSDIHTRIYLWIYTWISISTASLLIGSRTLSLNCHRIQRPGMTLNAKIGDFMDTATYWLKIANFSHPLSYSTLVRGDPL